MVAIGRKVKSVLSTHQQPSVRIVRESSLREEPHRVQAHRPPPQDASVNRFADARNRTGVAIRSLFGCEERDKNVTHDGSFENEYDSDMVDLLDVMGMYT